mgnify:CR=1 FL=1
MASKSSRTGEKSPVEQFVQDIKGADFKPDAEVIGQILDHFPRKTGTGPAVEGDSHRILEIAGDQFLQQGCFPVREDFFRLEIRLRPESHFLTERGKEPQVEIRNTAFRGIQPQDDRAQPFEKALVRSPGSQAAVQDLADEQGHGTFEYVSPQIEQRPDCLPLPQMPKTALRIPGRDNVENIQTVEFRHDTRTGLPAGTAQQEALPSEP